MDEFTSRLNVAIETIEAHTWSPDRTERALQGMIRTRKRRAMTRVVAAASVAAIAAVAITTRQDAPVERVAATTTAQPALVAAPTPSVEPLPEPASRAIVLSDGVIATPVDDAEIERVERPAPALRVIYGRAVVASATERKSPVEVLAGELELAVYATQFSVARFEQRAEVWSDDSALRIEWRGHVREVARGERAVFETDDPPREATAPRPDRTRREAASVDELLALADRARAEGRANEALAPLREVTRRYQADDRAPLAAFTLGRVLLEELDQPGAAATAFRSARELDPRGSMAEDALAREVEAWSKAGNQERARERAAVYLETYPSGHRVRAVRQFAGL